MLIISYVEICSKPSAILLYNFVCVYFAMFVLACHGGFSEGYYFSTVVCMSPVGKIKVTSELAGWEKRRRESGDSVRRKVTWKRRRGGGGVVEGRRQKVRRGGLEAAAGRRRSGAFVHLKTSSQRPISVTMSSDRLGFHGVKATE